MTDWKDTIMTDNDVLAKLRELPDDRWLDVIRDMHYQQRLLQAEKSFRSGWLAHETVARGQLKHHGGFCYKAGLREVVDMVKANEVPFSQAHGSALVVNGDKWREHLQAWGLGEGNKHPTNSRDKGL